MTGIDERRDIAEKAAVLDEQRLYEYRMAAARRLAERHAARIHPPGDARAGYWQRVGAPVMVARGPAGLCAALAHDLAGAGTPTTPEMLSTELEREVEAVIAERG